MNLINDGIGLLLGLAPVAALVAVRRKRVNGPGRRWVVAAVHPREASALIERANAGTAFQQPDYAPKDWDIVYSKSVRSMTVVPDAR